MNRTYKAALLFGFSHAVIDACCIYTLYSGIIKTAADFDFSFFCIIVYNIIAFGTQFIFGGIFDRTENPKVCAITGCILTGIAVLLNMHLLAAAIISGIGNSMFHAGAGIVCLKEGEGKSALPGMYTAPGAAGLFIGGIIAQKNFCPPVVFSLILAVFSILIYFYKTNFGNKIQTVNIKQEKIVFISVLLTWAIAIRSFLGLCISLPWKSNIILASLLTVAIVCGKFFGGIIADKFGWRKVTILALIISSPLIAQGVNNPFLFITGMFFFNFTMPVTLCAISNIMPEKTGFAFGLTTLALLLGALPSFFGINLTNNFLIFLIVLISALLIYKGLSEEIFLSAKSGKSNNKL